MNIGIIDGDFKKRGSIRGHYPNLVLMKISAWHKSKGDLVEFANPIIHYDKVYISKVFTFGNDPLKSGYPIIADEIELGGAFYDIIKTLPEEIEHITPDYSLYNISNTAYGFTTRGCIRKCGFCIVPKKEGSISPHADIGEFWREGQDLILMDNNILAHGHGIKQIEHIYKKNIPVDINQGIDARLIDFELAKLLCSLRKKTGYLRFAFDNMGEYAALKKISKWFLEITGRKRIQSMTMAYCLIDEFFDSYQRLCLLKELDIAPSPQIIMDLATGKRKDNLGNWILYQWSCMPQIFAHTFEEFVFKGISGKQILESEELRNTPREKIVAPKR